MRRRWSGWARPVIAILWAVTMVADPVQDWLVSRRERGVVRGVTRIERSQLELEPGQVVTILGQEEGRVQVSVARDVSGWVPMEMVTRTKEPS